MFQGAEFGRLSEYKIPHQSVCFTIMWDFTWSSSDSLKNQSVGHLGINETNYFKYHMGDTRELSRGHIC